MQRKIIHRSIYTWCLVFLVFVAGCLLLTNYDNIKRKIVVKVSKYIFEDADYNIQFDNVEVSFIKETSISNVVVLDNQKDTLFVCKKIKFKLLPFIFPYSSGNDFALWMDSTSINIKRFANKTWNIEHVRKHDLEFQSGSSDINISRYLKDIQSLTVTNLHIHIVDEVNHHASNLVLKDIHLNIDADIKTNTISLNNSNIKYLEGESVFKQFNISEYTKNAINIFETKPRAVFESIFNGLDRLIPLSRTTFVANHFDIHNGHYTISFGNKKTTYYDYLALSLDKLKLHKKDILIDFKGLCKFNKQNKSSKLKIELSKQKSDLVINQFILNVPKIFSITLDGGIHKTQHLDRKQTCISNLNIKNLSLSNRVLPNNPFLSIQKNTYWVVKGHLIDSASKTKIDNLNVSLNSQQVFKSSIHALKDNNGKIKDIHISNISIPYPEKIKRYFTTTKKVNIEPLEKIIQSLSVKNIHGFIKLSKDEQLFEGSFQTQSGKAVFMGKGNYDKKELNNLAIYFPSIKLYVKNKEFYLKDIISNVELKGSLYHTDVQVKQLSFYDKWMKDITLTAETKNFQDYNIKVESDDKDRSFVSVITLDKNENQFFFDASLSSDHFTMDSNYFFKSTNVWSGNGNIKGKFNKSSFLFNSSTDNISINGIPILEQHETIHSNLSYTNNKLDFKFHSPFLETHFSSKNNIKSLINEIPRPISKVNSHLIKLIAFKKDRQSYTPTDANDVMDSVSTLFRLTTSNRLDSIFKISNFLFQQFSDANITFSNNNTKTELLVDIPKLMTENIEIKNVNLDGILNQDEGKMRCKINKINYRKYFLNDIEVNSYIVDSTLSNTLSINSKDNDIYSSIKSKMSYSPSSNKLNVFIDSSYLNIKKDKWLCDGSSFSIENSFLVINTLDIHNGDQQIIGKSFVDTSHNKPNIITDIELKELDLRKYYSPFWNAGINWDFILNGKIHMLSSKNIASLSADLSLDNLYLNEVFVDHMYANIHYIPSKNIFSFKAKNNNPDYNFDIDGSILKADTSSTDINIHLHSVKNNILGRTLKHIFSFVDDGIMEGNVNIVFNKAKNIDMTGKIRTNTPTNVTVGFTDCDYSLDTIYATFTNKYIYFDNTKITDDNGNIGYIGGKIKHTNLSTETYDFAWNSDFIKCMDFKSSINTNYYGQMYGKINFELKADNQEANMTIDLEPEKPSYFNIDFTTDQQEAMKSITFITEKELNQKHIDTNKSLIITNSNEDNSDYVYNAKLHIHNAKSGIPINIYFNKPKNNTLEANTSPNLDITYSNNSGFKLNGILNLLDGKYYISFAGRNNVFDIEKDKDNIISWDNGNITNPILNLNVLKTIKDVRLKSSGQVTNIGNSSTYNPVSDVLLKTNVRGNKSNPTFNFDLTLPDNNTYTNDPNLTSFTSYLKLLKNNSNEMELQVASLLIFKAFTNSNIVANSINNNSNNGTSAVASQIISATANSLVFDKINGTIQDLLDNALLNNTIHFNLFYEFYNVNNAGSSQSLSNNSNASDNFRNIFTASTTKSFSEKSSLTLDLNFDAPLGSSENIASNVPSYFFLPSISYQLNLGNSTLNFFSNLNYNYINTFQQNSSGVSLSLNRESDKWYLRN